MRRHVTGIFALNTWLLDDIEPSSLTDASFKQDFTAMLNAETLADAEPHRLHLETVVKQRSVTVQNSDFARFWFQNGCLLILEDRYIEAFDAFSFCATLVPKSDAAARVQVLSRWTYVKMHLMYFTDAIPAYLEILITLDAHPEIPFRSGSVEAMRCNSHTQMAICFMRLGFFSIAQPHIQHAIELLNHWVRANTDNEMAESPGPLAPHAIPFLPLSEMPREVLESREPDVEVWMALHNTAVWTYGWILFWQCRLSRAREAALRDLQQYIEWLDTELTANFDEVHRVGEYQALSPGLQHLFRQTAAMAMFCAEAIFMLCQAEEMPLEEALILADNFIALAQDAHEQTSDEHKFKYFRYTSELTNLYREWRQIEQQGQLVAAQGTTTLMPTTVTKLQALIHKLMKLFAAEFGTGHDHVVHHFRGRYLVLLGQLYLAIGDEAHAYPILGEAEDIFTKEGGGGDLLRKIEVQQILKQEDEFIDDESLDDDEADGNGSEWK